MVVDSGDRWLKFRAGSHEALNDLYKDHFVILVNYGLKLTNDKELTIECITEMFLQLWEKRQMLPKVLHVQSYLITCLRNTILQRIRSEKIRIEKEGNAGSLTQNYIRSYEDEITDRQTNEQIKNNLAKSLAKLTDRQKELLKYRYFEELSYDEIAKNCNISKKTVYNIIFEAIKQLRSESSYSARGSRSFLTAFYVICFYDLFKQLIFI